MEKDLLLHGFILPVLALCLVVAVICLGVATLSQNKGARIICLQIICLLAAVVLAVVGFYGVWSALMFLCAVILLIIFGISIGQNQCRNKLKWYGKNFFLFGLGWDSAFCGGAYHQCSLWRIIENADFSQCLYCDFYRNMSDYEISRRGSALDSGFGIVWAYAEVMVTK